MKPLKIFRKARGLIAFIGAVIAFTGTIIGIIQYFENKTKYDLAGEWVIDLKIESTSYNPYKNMEVDYKVFLVKTISRRKAEVKNGGSMEKKYHFHNMTPS